MLSLVSILLTLLVQRRVHLLASTWQQLDRPQEPVSALDVPRDLLLSPPMLRAQHNSTATFQLRGQS